ncbi:MAG: hypothetical protein RL380_294 [Verrucomicrobiota bacterium]
MQIELINTGSELLLGRTLNTHAQWLARRLADRGLVVTRQTTVADTGSEIVAAVREALTRADLVITTGGLGPTSDDLTRQVLAEMLGKKLHEDATVLATIEKRFTARNRVMPASTRVQALVPESALVLTNAHGTAPGLAMEVRPGAWLIMLPGPPRELRPMFDEVVLPLLAEKFPGANAFTSLTLRTVGLGESVIEERIALRLSALVARGLEIGYCAHMGQVDVRLAAQGARREELVRAGEAIVRGELAETIFGTDDDLLETVVVRALTQRKQTLALAESCTGGFIANKITNVPGASAVLLAGLVTYVNAAKEKFAEVRAETLAQHGAVSEAVVREMAEGARRGTGADFAIAVTGIAGPGGGSAEKPVGTVFLALAAAGGTVVEKKFNAYEREVFKELTARQGLELLRQAMLTTKNPQG